MPRGSSTRRLFAAGDDFELSATRHVGIELTGFGWRGPEVLDASDISYAIEALGHALHWIRHSRPGGAER